MSRRPCPSCGECPCDCCRQLGAKFANKCIEFVFDGLSSETIEGDCECCDEVDGGTFRKGLTVYQQGNLLDPSQCWCVSSTWGVDFFTLFNNPTELDTECFGNYPDTTPCQWKVYANFYISFCDPNSANYADSLAYRPPQLGVHFFASAVTGAAGWRSASYGYNFQFAPESITDEEVMEKIIDLANGESITLPLADYGDPAWNPSSGGLPPNCDIASDSTVTIRLVPNDETCDDYPTEPPEPPYTCTDFAEDCDSLEDQILNCLIYNGRDRTVFVPGTGFGDVTIHWDWSEINSSFIADFITAGDASTELGGDCSIVNDCFRYRYGTVGDYDDAGKRICWIEFHDVVDLYKAEIWATGIYIRPTCQSGENEFGRLVKDGMATARVDIQWQLFFRNDSGPLSDVDFSYSSCYNGSLLELRVGRSFMMMEHCIAPGMATEITVVDTLLDLGSGLEDPTRYDKLDRFTLRSDLGPSP